MKRLLLALTTIMACAGPDPLRGELCYCGDRIEASATQRQVFVCDRACIAGNGGCTQYTECPTGTNGECCVWLVSQSNCVVSPATSDLKANRGFICTCFHNGVCDTGSPGHWVEQRQ